MGIGRLILLYEKSRSLQDCEGRWVANAGQKAEQQWRKQMYANVGVSDEFESSLCENAWEADGEEEEDSKTVPESDAPSPFLLLLTGRDFEKWKCLFSRKRLDAFVGCPLLIACLLRPNCTHSLRSPRLAVAVLVHQEPLSPQSLCGQLLLSLCLFRTHGLYEHSPLSCSLLPVF